MRFLSYTTGIVLVILGASFAVLNSQVFPVNYFFGKTTLYFPLLFLLLLMVGTFLGVLTMLPILIKSKIRIHKLKSKMKTLEQEITNLRQIPLKGPH